jgi:hypothetical protein
MPNAESHKKQIKINEDFYTETNKKQLIFYDWKITIMFYIILHYVDTIAAKQNIIKIKDHNERKRMIHIHNLLDRNEKNLYFELYDRSKLSRYECEYLNKKRAQSECLYVYDNLYMPLKNSLASKI